MKSREGLSALIRRTGMHRLVRLVRDPIEIRRFARAGSTGPAPHGLKVELVQKAAKTRGIEVLIETGTYRGDMVAAVLPMFRRIVTIELSPDLHRAAKARFARWPHVECIQGDSAERMASVLSELREPALFWLDAHWSGGITARAGLDTPITAELEAILAHPVRGHVILVDDARHFDGSRGYPTVDSLCEEVKRRKPQSRIEIADDIISIALG